MIKVSNLQPVVFIPYYHVINPSITITKLRIVFVGSWVMDSYQSLNDMLHRDLKL